MITLCQVVALLDEGLVDLQLAKSRRESEGNMNVRAGVAWYVASSNIRPVVRDEAI
jgi:hypothetical protein